MGDLLATDMDEAEHYIDGCFATIYLDDSCGHSDQPCHPRIRFSILALWLDYASTRSGTFLNDRLISPEGEQSLSGLSETTSSRSL